MISENDRELEALALRVREHAVRMAAAGGCFLGSALSCTDLLVFLYKRFLRVGPKTIGASERDWFLLSKGHAVPALYGVLAELGYFHPDRLQDTGNRAALNLMKGGIVYSNFVTTVSPHYAWEIMNTNQDYGLGRTLHTHAGKIGGILNGLDYDTWNPEVDRHIPQVYGPATPDKKYADKQALRQRFWLQDVFKPIVSYIGRLDHQKGVPLITHAINYCLQHGCQFVLLGTSPDAKIAQHFWALKRQYNDNPDCHIEIGFNEDLSHLIYAGADMIIVPSLFEPCGLTQLIGLKYGTVPIVRGVGGLADTVFDANYSPKPYAERNGYVFNDFNPAGIESALSRAIGLWYNYAQHFRELMLNGMRYDYSWNHSGEHYLNVYDLIREK